MSTTALVSIVVPVFNEEGNLHRFHEAVSAVMRTIDGTIVAVTFVDDGRREVGRGRGRDVG